jgi:hypothetical protein
LTVSSDDVLAMGRCAWAWILRHQDEFFVRGGNELKRTKLIAELALTASALTDEMPEARAVVARAWDELGEGEHIVRLIKTLPTIASAYWPFCFAGLRSSALEASLADAAWLRDHARLAPFARFAIGVVLGSVGVAAPWSEREVVLANRFFDQPTSQTHPLRAEFLAHAIMWRSEMGRNHAPVASAMKPYCQVSPTWHQLLAGAGLLDPLGEMIIADSCIGTAPPSSSLEMLRANQRDDGSVPSLVGGPADRFEDLYHTTCVTALAGTLAACTAAAER